ncbi:MAG: PAS domain-containing protein [Mojavia pulchra JT2-VF2]|jgi:PAS domain S-box-containing protein|uniref:Circadian input-output histidine kinase CikA n=1 Tax=Mojavia pulchra JT2-VF2 TaxID=287848 RepID=A0A951Q2Z1_9NOST|nr:PAS domain-containing protein [Mojavia pulchra JT2-VF2]
MTSSKDIFAGGGEMGELMRTQDWSATALGPVTGWSQSLLTSISIILNSPAPMSLLWGREYVLLYNDAYRPFLGTKHPQALGQPGLEVWAEVSQILEPMLQSVLDEESATWQSDRLLQIERQGHLQEEYFTFSYSPIRDESGGIGGIFCFVTETTERVLGERAQLAINVGQIGTWRYDPNTNLVELDARMRQIWGEPDNVVTMPLPIVMERIHPDDRAQVANAIDTALDPRSSGTYEIDYRIVWVDGTERWVSVNGQVQFQGEGEIRRPVGFLGIALDITDRKQVEEAFSQSESRFQTLVRNMPGMVYRYNPGDHCFTYVSSGCRDLLELEPETLLENPNSFWELIHPDDLQSLTDSVSTAVQHSLPWKWEGRVITPSGKLKWIQGNSRPEGTTCEKVWDGLLIDISERKFSEAEREQLLAREQAARAEAERVNRIKDEFLAVLSHELRSPLNPILGWAQLLQGRKLDEQTTQRGLETIERNAKLQTQMIEDLLDVSRILRGKLVLNPSPVNLVTVIQEAIETVRLAAEAKRVEIHTVFANDLERVSGDSVRLQQVVWNLLSNAIKFSSEGGQVEIRLERVGNYAQIQVKDTGKGINPAFLPHVFEYFRQEDAATTRQFGGLGIGLAIGRYLIELHGGTIHAESPGEGLGATFTVRIPLMMNPSESSQDTNSDISAIDLSGLRVLVVDDEADMRELAAFVLQQCKAEVKVAASAMEALTIFEQFNPNVLISDIGMPIIDGYMLMREVRRRSPQQGGQIPAIALTAYAGEVDQQKALSAGFQRHLAKPVQPKELIKAIVALLERRDKG